MKLVPISVMPTPSILALSWSVLQHGGQTASPLQALIRRLIQTRREQLITLRRLSEMGADWTGLAAPFCAKMMLQSSLGISVHGCRGCLIFAPGWCEELRLPGYPGSSVGVVRYSCPSDECAVLRMPRCNKVFRTGICRSTSMASPRCGRCSFCN